jgi:predicted nucleic acid-binding protein
MKSFKIYLDTSVISMIDNPDLGAVTREFFEFAKQKNCEFMISEVVKNELDESKKNKGGTILTFFETLDCVPLVYNDSAHYLAERYIEDGVLTEKHIDDLTHVAYATVYKCDMIVSWNRRHIAKPIKIQKINNCNLKNNYPMIAIYTPGDFLLNFKEVENEN